jgi:hypothetical protein
MIWRAVLQMASSLCHSLVLLYVNHPFDPELVEGLGWLTGNKNYNLAIVLKGCFYL